MSRLERDDVGRQQHRTKQTTYRMAFRRPGVELKSILLLAVICDAFQENVETVELHDAADAEADAQFATNTDSSCFFSFVQQPIGFGNQLYNLLGAIEIAAESNCTLIIPPFMAVNSRNNPMAHDIISIPFLQRPGGMPSALELEDFMRLCEHDPTLWPESQRTISCMHSMMHDSVCWTNRYVKDTFETVGVTFAEHSFVPLENMQVCPSPVHAACSIVTSTSTACFAGGLAHLRFHTT